MGSGRDVGGEYGVVGGCAQAGFINVCGDKINLEGFSGAFFSERPQISLINYSFSDKAKKEKPTCIGRFRRGC